MVFAVFVFWLLKILIAAIRFAYNVICNYRAVMLPLYINLNIMNRITLILSMTLLASKVFASSDIEYPKAPSSSTIDDYFGTKVVDPYRPLENDTAVTTMEWVEAENLVTRGYLDRIPFREAIKNRLTALNDYRKHGMPWLMYDGKYYFFENDGLRNQSVLYRMNSLGDNPEVFIDPNTLSDDGTVALTGLSQSRDGRYTAYTISRSGSDWTEIYVMDTKTKRLLPDHIEWAKFTSASWVGDGFFYSAYDRPEAGKEFSNANECHRIYYHKLGTSQSDDRLVYMDSEHPLHFYSAQVPEDESYLFVYGGGEGLGNSLFMKKMSDVFDDSKPWIIIEPSQDYQVSVIDVIVDKMILYTSWGAERYRLMTASVDAPQRENWTEIVGQGEGVLVGAEVADSDKLVLTYDRDASQCLYVCNIDGENMHEIKLPTYGSVATATWRKSSEMFYSFTSFTYPTVIYRYDIATGLSEVYKTTEIQGIDFEDYVTEQVFYPSADGTKIPMFLTYKKDLKRDGKNPVYLYGYGGFNITLTPGFSAQRLLWLENGGIYAQANLRGGGEYGESWHLAGTKQQKLNVFNDFIAAAEYMIEQGWSNPERIVIEGGSNGGLLVGATVNMRPDLFKVAIPRVGVMDMMRYHLFTIGWNWASDYGTSADSKEMADYLLGYSPIHNIKNDGTRYPAILITTADHDDRVVPAHSFKYAATLQAADTGDAPKLIRIDSKAGHGAGKPISKVIDEYADMYSFIFVNMGLVPIKNK